jgi:hypothetical protein
MPTYEKCICEWCKKEYIDDEKAFNEKFCKEQCANASEDELIQRIGDSFR